MPVCAEPVSVCLCFCVFVPPSVFLYLSVYLSVYYLSVLSGVRACVHVFL